MNPALSPTTTGCLPRRLARPLTRSKMSSAGDDGLDDLDELHDRCRIEEVHADDPLGVARGNGDLGDRQGGGVGREDGVLVDDLVELGEDVLLQVEVLRHRLDDELAVLEVVEVRGELHARDEGRLVLLGELAAGDGTARGGVEVFPTARHRLVVDLDGDHLDAVASEDLDDAGTHGAESDAPW